MEKYNCPLCQTGTIGVEAIYRDSNGDQVWMISCDNDWCPAMEEDEYTAPYGIPFPIDEWEQEMLGWNANE
jgi:hypothetical protein